jgi:hypothetical protein
MVGGFNGISNSDEERKKSKDDVRLCSSGNGANGAGVGLMGRGWWRVCRWAGWDRRWWGEEGRWHRR